VTSRFALPVVVGLLMCSLPVAARADDGGVEDCDQSTVIEPDTVEVVVPCGLVDSGALGPDCHDAAFYVVNHQGTLLCRVDVAVLGANVPTSSIDDGPPADAPSPSSVMAPAAVTVAIDLQVLPARVDDVARAVGPPGLGGGIDVDGTRPRPS